MNPHLLFLNEIDACDTFYSHESLLIDLICLITILCS